MKKNLLLGALCLPMVFAACTSEELMETNVVDNGNMPAGRAVVELEVTTGTDSRMTMENGAFVWEDTDKLGSVLVDPTTLWTVDATKTIGNNRWDYNNGRFATQGTTVEGAWMFYFPYDPAVSSSRDGVKVTKSIQYQNYDPDGKLMAANDFRVSPIYFVNAAEGGKSNIEVRLNSVYSYGLIDATFPEDVTVDKVLIKTENGKMFNDKLAIKPALIAAQASMNYAKMQSAGKLVPQALGGTTTQIWADPTAAAEDKVPSAQKAEYALQDWALEDEYADEDVDAIVTAESQIDYILVSCGEGVATTSKKFSTNVLLPAGGYDFDFDVYFYTNKGVYKYDLVDPATYGGDDLLYKRGCTVKLNNVNQLEEVVIGGSNALAPATMSVSTKENDPYIVENKDLLTLIKSVTVSTSLTPKLLGTVTIDDAIAAALKANEKVTALNVTNMHVACGTQTISKLNASGTLTLNEGADVTFGGGEVANLVVEEGATATLNANIGKSGATTLVKGTLNIANIVGTYLSKIGMNGGTLNIGTAVADNVVVPTINGYLNNIESGELNINVKFHNASGANSPILGLASGDDVLNVTVNENFTTNPAKPVSVLAKAVIDNKAVMAIDSNAGEINNAGDLTVTTNSGTIDNEGLAEVGTNNGTINQLSADAELVCTTNGANCIINATTAESETTVTTNNGEIVIVDMARVQATGAISYSASEDFTASQLSSLDNRISKVIFNGDFEYTYPDAGSAPALPTGLTQFVFKGNLTIGKDWAMPSNSVVSFIGAKANISGGTLTNVQTLSFGVAKVTDGSGNVTVAAVPTDAYIAQGVVLGAYSGSSWSGTLVNLNLLGDAEVWNNGDVYAATAGNVTLNGVASSQPAKADGWKGYAIK